MPLSAAKARPRHELVMRLVQPLADRGVRWLAATGLNPLWLVLIHGLLGFAAALLVARGAWLLAALLLQLKTLLDNMDGGLARVSGRVTLMGRYFDTGADLLVNLALFAAIARYGDPLLALTAFALLTFLLSLDYNAERLYRLERTPPNPPPNPLPDPAALPIGAPLPLYLAFKRLYDLFLAPQDRFIAVLERRRFERLSRTAQASAPLELRLAWADLFSSASLVNLGLSSQMFVLGLCLVLGQPFWYVYAVFLQSLYVLCVQLLREARFRAYLRGMNGLVKTNPGVNETEKP